MSFGINDIIDYYVCAACNLLVKGEDALAFLEDGSPNGYVLCTKVDHKSKYCPDTTYLPISKLNDTQKAILRIIQYSKATSVPGGC